MNEDDQSPWGMEPFPVPEFVRLPVLNPKTGESPVLSVCVLCGSLVVNRTVHTTWHHQFNHKIIQSEHW